MTTRVGSPPVWESMILILFRAGMRAAIIIDRIYRILQDA
jgi:hypothetical protein